MIFTGGRPRSLLLLHSDCLDAEIFYIYIYVQSNEIVFTTENLDNILRLGGCVTKKKKSKVPVGWLRYLFKLNVEFWKSKRSVIFHDIALELVIELAIYNFFPIVLPIFRYRRCLIILIAVSVFLRFVAVDILFLGHLVISHAWTP